MTHSITCFTNGSNLLCTKKTTDIKIRLISVALSCEKNLYRENISHFSKQLFRL